MEYVNVERRADGRYHVKEHEDAPVTNVVEFDLLSPPDEVADVILEMNDHRDDAEVIVRLIGENFNDKIAFGIVECNFIPFDPVE